ncbi:MAG: hypothetical protein IJY42_02135, partial [Clostridia bacterium]|nr:hypothetical protein [Clostridia bacterium]
VLRVETQAEKLRFQGEGATFTSHRLPTILSIEGQTPQEIFVADPADPANERGIPLAEVAIDELNTAEMILYATATGSEHAANTLLEQWNGQTDPINLWLDFLQFQDQGYALGEGKSLVDGFALANKRYQGIGLDEAARFAAYQWGSSMRQKRRERLIREAEAQEEAWKQTGAVKREGRFEDESLRYGELDEQQTALVYFARLLSQYLGVNVTLFASEKGNRPDANGYYDGKTNTICLDVFAGIENDSNYVAVRSCLAHTVSHEVVHNLARTAPKEYGALRDFVLGILAKDDGYDLQKQIHIILREEKITEPEIAIEEIVARACEDLLGKSRRIPGDMAAFAQENRKAAKVIGEAFLQFIAKLKQFFRRVLGKTVSTAPEAQIMAEQTEELLDELVRLYEDAFFHAREGNQALNHAIETKKASSGGETKEAGQVRYKRRETLEAAAQAMETISNEQYLTERSEAPFVLAMDYTPQAVLHSMDGAQDRQVLIRRDALYLAVRENGVQKGHYHNLGANVLQKLPRYLESPDVILSTVNPETGVESQTRRIVLSHLDGANGQGILSIELESIKDFEGVRNPFHVVITVLDLHQNDLHSLFRKHGAEIKAQKENLAQVNPQLYEWLRSMNARFSDIMIPHSPENVNPSDPNSSDERLSYAEDSGGTITRQDVAVLRSIGRKSVNQLTRKELQAAEKWARKFYGELGIKSPFFRAWFGDWRADDPTRIQFVDVENIDIDIALIRSERGTFFNEDTKWNVVSGSVGEGETKRYARGDKVSVKMLSSLQKILKSAILIDTEVSMKDSSKKHK